jgi:hypothetical protein
LRARSSGVWKACSEEGVEWSEGFAREVAGMEMVSAVWRAEVVDWDKRVRP